jgi:polyisoprenoid-binding protein YceI
MTLNKEMIMKKVTLLFFIVAGSLSAQNQWKLDRSHSSINFAVSHLVISEVTGTFREFDAQMESSQEDFTDAKISVTIKAKSIDTGNEGRDRHLRNQDFFNADVDSNITFNSTKIEKQQNGKYKIIGLLTMRGISKEVVLDATYKGNVMTRKGMVAAFKAVTSIQRSEWGLTWNRAIESGGVVVGENVDLTINVEFVKSKQ